MAGINVLGIDLSLTATGLAVIAGDYGHNVRTLKPPAKLGTGHERLAWILDQIWDITYSYDGGHLVVVEGPSYGAKGSAVHQIAGLWWLVVHKLWTSGIDTAVVPPAALKKYATGAGNASKDAMMLATARRFPDFNGDNNAADALWLAAAGADRAGRPIVSMPAANRAALDAVAWPDTLAAVVGGGD